MTGWTRALLIGSLALNLAVAGLVAGALLRDRGMVPGLAARAVPLDPGLGPWGPALSREDRAAIRRDFASERAEVMAGLRAERADRAAMVAALRAVPFDSGAMDAAAARMVARMHERVELGQRLIRARILAMSPSERAAFADRLEAAFASGPGGPRDGRHGRDRGEARGDD